MAKMMNLLLLVLVTLPGVTLSFSNTANPWKDLYYRQLQLASDQDVSVPPTDPQIEGYVCCNQPGSMDMSRRRPQNPRLPHYPHHSLLSLVKRDYRDALLREAMRDANNGRPTGGPDPINALPDTLRLLSSSPQTAGGYPSSPLRAEWAGGAAARDSLLTGLLGLLKSSSGGNRPGGGDAALASGYDGSTILGKRRGPGWGVLGGINVPFKRFFDRWSVPGGINVGWPGQQTTKRTTNVAPQKKSFGVLGGPNVPWPKRFNAQQTPVDAPQKRMPCVAGGHNCPWSKRFNAQQTPVDAPQKRMCELGGPNCPWPKRFNGAETGEPGGINVAWKWSPQQMSKKFANR